MKDPHSTWLRLVKAARLEAPEAAQPPPGFAVRVAALARSRRDETPSWYPSFAWRAVAVAAVIAGITTTLQVRSWSSLVETEIASMATGDADTEEVS